MLSIWGFSKTKRISKTNTNAISENETNTGIYKVYKTEEWPCNQRFPVQNKGLSVPNVRINAHYFVCNFNATFVCSVTIPGMNKVTEYSVSLGSTPYYCRCLGNVDMVTHACK